MVQIDRVMIEVPATKGTIYICGPMTGYDNFNYDAFNQAEIEWRQRGWTVKNPARNFAGRQDLPYTTYIRQAIVDVMNSTALAVLPNWMNSGGALTELHVALTLGHPIYDARTGEPNQIPLAEVGWFTYKKEIAGETPYRIVREEVQREVHAG